MRRSVISVALVLLLGSLSFEVGCATSSSDPGTEAVSPPSSAKDDTTSVVNKERTQSSVLEFRDYPSYSSLDELAGHSTAMVRGVVSEIEPSILNGPGVIDPARAKDGLDWVATPITVRVAELLAGSGFAAGTDVRILRHGGKIGERSTPIPDEEATYEVGQAVVLFIYPAAAPIGEINAVVVGAAQGAYRVDSNGVLHATRPSPGDNDVDAKIRGTEMKVVAQQAASLIGKRRQ